MERDTYPRKWGLGPKVRVQYKTGTHSDINDHYDKHIVSYGTIWSEMLDKAGCALGRGCQG